VPQFAPEITVSRATTYLFFAYDLCPGLLAAVASVVFYFTLNRTMLGLNAVADRNPLFVTLSDGSVRNSFTLRVLNKRYATRTFAISIDGIPGAARVLISVSPEALKNLPHGEILNFEFKVRDTEDASEVTRAATFRKPT
jgi:polyferredoxin